MNATPEFQDEKSTAHDREFFTLRIMSCRSAIIMNREIEGATTIFQSIVPVLVSTAVVEIAGATMSEIIR